MWNRIHLRLGDVSLGEANRAGTSSPPSARASLILFVERVTASCRWVWSCCHVSSGAGHHLRFESVFHVVVTHGNAGSRPCNLRDINKRRMLEQATHRDRRSADRGSQTVGAQHVEFPRRGCTLVAQEPEQDLELAGGERSFRAAVLVPTGHRAPSPTASRKFSTRWVSSAVASASYDGRELSAKRCWSPG